jgi:hypothetical protein
LLGLGVERGMRGLGKELGGADYVAETFLETGSFGGWNVWIEGGLCQWIPGYISGDTEQRSHKDTMDEGRGTGTYGEEVIEFC